MLLVWCVEGYGENEEGIESSLDRIFVIKVTGSRTIPMSQHPHLPSTISVALAVVDRFGVRVVSGRPLIHRMLQE